jgi:hypothetical protein
MRKQLPLKRDGRMKTKIRTKKAVKTKRRLSLLNIKISRKDRKALDAAAGKYAKGNLSAWLRFAGTSFKRQMPAIKG